MPPDPKRAAIAALQQEQDKIRQQQQQLLVEEARRNAALDPNAAARSEAPVCSPDYTYLHLTRHRPLESHHRTSLLILNSGIRGARYDERCERETRWGRGKVI